MDASPICRGQNLTMETVLTFMHAMPKQAMAKADFNAYAESRMNGWTQTHSQIARQMALYYEEGGICYPRFGSKVSIGDIVEYAKHWATRYFIPNPYTPSLKGKTPTTIYAYLKKAIHEGKYTFSEACNSIFPETTLNNLDKVRVFLVNFTDILVEGDKMSVNNEVEINENTEIHPSIEALTSKEYFYHFGGVIESAQADHQNEEESPLQQIFYGAPGTGKSHGIKKEIKKLTGMDDDENNPYVFRTTFHPDYDYAQFVGCYKPIKDKNDKQKITYEFVPQTFTNAYIKAYQCKSPVVLVIEEINRGNCAQIFGDIFQLLDRDLQGYSEYSIRPDQDLLEYLKEKCPESVNGDRIKLPSNMSILATMNTSDQSLFPMDSAFKRRWDWRYVPIEIGRDKEGKALKWKIVADENEYDWMSFVTEINKRIYKATESEDKQLGFFFCKANTEGVISVDAFTSKVLSYLWTDVFKDSDFDSNMFEDGNGGKITFASLYDNIDNINEQLVAKFIDNVGTKKVGEVDYYDDENDAETHKTQQTDMNTKTKDFSKYIINGDTNKPLSKRKLVRKAINMFVEKNKELSVERMLEELRRYNVDVAHFVDSEDEYFDRFKDSNDSKQSQRASLIKWGDDDENKIYVSTQWGAGNIEEFLNKFKVDYIKIEKYN